MSAEILLYAIIAAGLVFWLKSIIGTTDDEDDKIREDKAEKRSDDIFATVGKKRQQNDQNAKLAGLTGEKPNLPAHVRFDNKTAENNMEDFIKKHPDFDLDNFLGGAEQAFIMIVESFADEETQTLKDLLAEPVYKAFYNVIEERQSKGEKVTTSVQSVDKMEIVEVHNKDGMIYITVRFYVREICVIRNDAGEILSGDVNKVTSMVDVWVFGQPENAKSPEWLVCETRDEKEEDHKTPMPEAGKTK